MTSSRRSTTRQCCCSLLRMYPTACSRRWRRHASPLPPTCAVGAGKPLPCGGPTMLMNTCTGARSRAACLAPATTQKGLSRCPPSYTRSSIARGCSWMLSLQRAAGVAVGARRARDGSLVCRRQTAQLVALAAEAARARPFVQRTTKKLPLRAFLSATRTSHRSTTKPVPFASCTLSGGESRSFKAGATLWRRCICAATSCTSC
mmetsp:Transcript_16938/g.59244  ORF Transcript_16938/g.59244 Transcript_16938/m.59244 type:complete len:204 (+) Transcript_16938:1802-2413(+)